MTHKLLPAGLLMLALSVPTAFGMPGAEPASGAESPAPVAAPEIKSPAAAPVDGSEVTAVDRKSIEPPQSILPAQPPAGASAKEASSIQDEETPAAAE